ncbi:Uncharacterized protein GBIM_11926 [Gryllus bimaculatus]|nr:Uncharacterized protein GBIM_11926 [Gryllus bimaculatus]
MTAQDRTCERDRTVCTWNAPCSISTHPDHATNAAPLVRFCRILRNVAVEVSGKPTLEFNPDGRLRNAELDIMNLRPQPAPDTPAAWEKGVGKAHLGVNPDAARLAKRRAGNIELRQNPRRHPRGRLGKIGVWKSWQKEGLDIKDIVWPGNSHTPPQGVPEKFHLKITFLEEPPYINLSPPDPVTGKCTHNKGVFCRHAKESDISG